jgi:hypothetical protein
MAIPIWTGNGTRSATAGIATPTVPSHSSNDILWLPVGTSNDTVTAPTGWIEGPADSPQGHGPASGTTAVRLTSFWTRCGPDPVAGPSIADSGDNTIGIIVGISGCTRTGSPFHVSAGNTEPAAVSNVTIPGDTTTAIDCLVIAAVAYNDPTLDDGAQCSEIMNVSLSNVQQMFDTNSLSGNDTGMAAMCGGLAVAGPYDVSTATLAAAQTQARLSFALLSHNPGELNADPAISDWVEPMTMSHFTVASVSAYQMGSMARRAI